MTHREIIVLLLTLGAFFLTFAKVMRKETKWYWELAPMASGAGILAWLAYFFV